MGFYKMTGLSPRGTPEASTMGELDDIRCLGIVWPGVDGLALLEALGPTVPIVSLPTFDENAWCLENIWSKYAGDKSGKTNPDPNMRQKNT